MTKIIQSRYGFLAVLPAILMVNLLTEQFDLSDHATPVIRRIMQTPWGIALVALVSPVVEELIFRLCIIGSLLRWTHISPWTAILISTALFATAHWNPAQTPGALAIGIMLGTFYWRSGLWLSILVHIINNTLAVVEYKMLGYRADTFTLTDTVGGPAVAWILIALTTYITLWSMHRYIQDTK